LVFNRFLKSKLNRLLNTCWYWIGE